MYGTIFRMKVKPGQEQRVVDATNQWFRERRPKVPGFIASFLQKPDNTSGELIGVAVFQDKESYVANSADPEQDRWYRQLRELLEADPQWQDGEYLTGRAN